MNPRWRGLLSGLIVAVLLASGCSRDAAPRVAAVVEGVKLPSSETEALIRTYLKSGGAKEDTAKTSRDDRDKTVARFVLLYQIKLALLDVLATQMGIPRAPVPREDLATQMMPAEAFQSAGLRPEDLIQSSEAGQLSKSMAEKLFPDVAVTDADLHQEYDRRAPLNNGAWRVTAQVASFTAADPARQFVTRVRQGQRFDEAASALGAVQTGNVDITPVSPLPKPVVDAVGQLHQGQVAEPIELKTGGWVCIVAKRRQDLPNLSFDDVREELTHFLRDQQRQSLFQDWFDKKLRTARIRVSRYYGSWNQEEATVR